MDVGVFIPIGNNGWLISTTAPQYMPSFDLNREIVQRADRYGLDFALSMIKLRGFGGPSQFWDHNLESFTLMSGLAAVTERIKLFASVPVLTMPPPFVARMATTIDSISHGRFGINIVSGWQKAEYAQMGIWPGESHYAHRYQYCAEYVTVMRELWATGRSDFKGTYFQMDDCRMSPMPSAPIQIVGAAQSDVGTRFAAEYCDYNFCSSSGVNTPTAFAPNTLRLVKEVERTGRPCSALVLFMIIAEETDAAAEAKWEYYKSGVDLDAMAWRESQASKDPNKDPNSTAQRWRRSGSNHPNTGHGALVGSYAKVAAMLDEIEAVPGVSGVMLTFDDFVAGMDKFGQRIQPLMQSRRHIRSAATA